MTDYLNKVLGATGKVIKNMEVSSSFFRPYDSPKNFALRVSSIVVAPIAFSGLSILCLVSAGYELLKAIGNAINQDFAASKENIGEAGSGMTGFGLFIVAALISPLANLIDVLGSVITSIQKSCLEGNEDNETAANYSIAIR